MLKYLEKENKIR